MQSILSRIAENLVSFVIWYTLWQLADFVLKLH
jgi:hypothetical protein